MSKPPAKREDNMILDGMTPAIRSPLTLQEINEQNCRFWGVRADICAKRMADESLCDFAIEYLRSDTKRGFSLRLQKSLDQALADAEMARDDFQVPFLARGGRARKCDALQRLILRIVRRKLNINNQQVLYRLKKEIGDGTIISIDGRSDVLAGGVRKIHFYDDNGTEKTARVSGLKDRLSRAKKNIRANRQKRAGTV
jgi:hypothetical protein